MHWNTQKNVMLKELIVVLSDMYADEMLWRLTMSHKTSKRPFQWSMVKSFLQMVLDVKNTTID